MSNAYDELNQEFNGKILIFHTFLYYQKRCIYLLKLIEFLAKQNFILSCYILM